MGFLHTATINLTIIFGFMIAFSSNPMNSILFLIGIFFNSFILLSYFHIEFLSVLFVLIYVGAIAILFLFVIMMLNLKSVETNALNFNFVFKTFLVAIFFYLFFFAVFHFLDSLYADSESFLLHQQLNTLSTIDVFSNINSIGQTLFNYFSGCFLVAGLILLTALVGAIVLSQNFKTGRSGVNVPAALARHRGNLLRHSAAAWLPGLWVKMGACWAGSKKFLWLLAFSAHAVITSSPAELEVLRLKAPFYLKWLVAFVVDAMFRTPKTRRPRFWEFKLTTPPAKPWEFFTDSFSNFLLKEVIMIPGKLALIIFLINAAGIICCLLGAGSSADPDSLLPPSDFEFNERTAEPPMEAKESEIEADDPSTEWTLLLWASAFLLCSFIIAATKTF